MGSITSKISGKAGGGESPRVKNASQIEAELKAIESQIRDIARKQLGRKLGGAEMTEVRKEIVKIYVSGILDLDEYIREALRKMDQLQKIEEKIGTIAQHLGIKLKKQARMQVIDACIGSKKTDLTDTIFEALNSLKKK